MGRRDQGQDTTGTYRHVAIDWDVWTAWKCSLLLNDKASLQHRKNNFVLRKIPEFKMIMQVRTWESISNSLTCDKCKRNAIIQFLFHVPPSDRFAGIYLDMVQVCDAQVTSALNNYNWNMPPSHIHPCLSSRHVTSGIECCKNQCLDLWRLWNCQHSFRSGPAQSSPDLSALLQEITWVH